MNDIAFVASTYQPRTPASANNPAVVRRLILGLATVALLSGGVGAVSGGVGLAGIAQADPVVGLRVPSGALHADVAVDVDRQERRLPIRRPIHRPVRHRPHARPIAPVTQGPGWYGGAFHCGGAIPCSLFP